MRWIQIRFPRWTPYFLGGFLLFLAILHFVFLVRVVSWAQMNCGETNLSACDLQVGSAFEQFHLLAVIALAVLLPFKKRWCRLAALAVALIDIAVGGWRFLSDRADSIFYRHDEAVAVVFMIFIVLGLVVAFCTFSLATLNRSAVRQTPYT